MAGRSLIDGASTSLGAVPVRASILSLVSNVPEPLLAGLVEAGLGARRSLSPFSTRYTRRMSVLAPTPPERLVDSKGRPYFLCR